MQSESTGTDTAAGVNRRSVITGAASLGAVAALAALWRRTTYDLANAQGDTTIDLLNLGLQSEYLMCSAYQEAVESGAILNERDLEFVQAMLAECVAGVEQFRTTIDELGGEPIAETGMAYPEDAQRDRESCLALLLELESVTMRGWHGAAPMVQDPSIVVLAQQLGLTKARRAGALAFLLGEAAPAFPSPVVTGMPLAEALEQLEPYRGAPE